MDWNESSRRAFLKGLGAAGAVAVTAAHSEALAVPAAAEEKSSPIQAKMAESKVKIQSAQATTSLKLKSKQAADAQKLKHKEDAFTQDMQHKNIELLGKVKTDAMMGTAKAHAIAQKPEPTGEE